MFFDIKKKEKEDRERLEKLQALRRKAGYKRKLSYTIRIEEEIFGIER